MKTVEEHYAQPGLLERVREALRQSGLNPEKLQRSDLKKFDQFHVGGLDATDAMARLAQIRESDAVLDMGSGIGGPSRHLAATIGCHVTGLDLTDEYCQVAKMLAEATGLVHLVRYEQGDALAAPFKDGSFNVVWSQHAAMNIEDKRGLYREAFRLLKPGGRLAIHDVMSGTGEVRYPVPWASDLKLSFLITGEELNGILRDAGFRNIVSEDVTEQGLEAIRQVADRASSGTPELGLGMLMGPQFPGMVGNLMANLGSGACRIVRAVYVK